MLLLLALWPAVLGGEECASGPAREAPGGLPPAVAELLDDRAVAFMDGEGELGVVVPVRQLPSADGAASPYPASGKRLHSMIAPGSLVGVLVLEREWADARGQAVSPGEYGLRYVLQPRMKDHMGTSDWSDFLVLVPIEEAVEALAGVEGTIDAGRSPGGRHPVVLSLARVEGLAACTGEGDNGPVVNRLVVGGEVLGLRADHIARPESE